MSSKALVVMGTNFATNKVATVSFSGSVPCTGITVTSATMSLTAEGQEETIGYTLAPSNTTDIVGIESSDTSVVTIVNGKAKAVGVGTATITITCGTQTATISVTCEFIMAWNFAEQYSLSASTLGDYTFTTDSSAAYWGYCGAEDTWGDGRYIAINHDNRIPVYKIPQNCTKISITVPSSSWKSRVYFYDSTKGGAYSTSTDASLVSYEDSAVSGDRLVTVDANADSFAIAYRAPDITFDATDLTGYNATLQ